MRFADALKMKESTLKRFMRLPRFPEHLQLHRMDCLSSHGDLTLYNFVKQRFESTPADQVRPRPLLTGHDLIRAGHKPGPELKAILAAVEDAQLEGHLHTQEQAMEFVRQQFAAEKPST